MMILNCKWRILKQQSEKTKITGGLSGDVVVRVIIRRSEENIFKGQQTEMEHL